MISEFHDLSAKIDQLAEMTHALRRENAQLRQANTRLADENESYKWLLDRAQTRLSDLLAALPPDDQQIVHDAMADAGVAAQPDEAAR